ncbi:MAG: taurine ABC transporter substrate-binding protein, partial [Pseudomonas caspiana]
MIRTIKALLLAVAAATAAPAHAADIVIAYQTGVDPSKVAQADGAYEKAIGEKLDWRRFNSG